jgi:hypothetical protein
MTDGLKVVKKKCAKFSLYYKNLKKNFFLKSNNLLKIEEKNQWRKKIMVIAHGNIGIQGSFFFYHYVVIILDQK